MHQLNVLILGPASFISTLNELKQFLKFNPIFDNLNNKHDVYLIHDEVLNDKNKKKFIDSTDTIKIYASKKKKLVIKSQTK